jgi:hypothetical protein
MHESKKMRYHRNAGCRPDSTDLTRSKFRMIFYKNAGSRLNAPHRKYKKIAGIFLYTLPE